MRMFNYFIDFFIYAKMGLVGIIMNYVVAVLIPILFGEFSIHKLSDILSVALRAVICCVAMFLLCSIYYIIITPGMPQVCGAILTVVYTLFFCKFTIPSKIITSMSFICINMNVFVVCFSIGDLIKATGSNGDQIIVCLLSIVLLSVCVLFFKAFNTSKHSYVPAISVVMVILVGTGNIIFWLLTNFLDMDTALKIVIGIIMLVLLMFAYYSAYAISRNNEINNKKRAEISMERASQKLLQMSEDNLKSLRAVKHELNNQCAYMKALIEAKEYEKLNVYFQNFTDVMFKKLEYVDCGNFTVNAILAAFSGRIADNNINFHWHIVIPPQLEISDVDICSILMNILNNAIEYFDRNKELESKNLSLFMSMVNKMLIVKVNNNLRIGDEKNAIQLKTSKDEKLLHGYGTRVLNTLVKKYDGVINYSAENGIFTVKAMLLNEKSA